MGLSGLIAILHFPGSSVPLRDHSSRDGLELHFRAGDASSSRDGSSKTLLDLSYVAQGC